MSDYVKSSPAERAGVVAEIARQLGSPWQPSIDDPTLLEVDLDAMPEECARRFGYVTFAFVPGGRFRPGLSEREDAILTEWVETDSARQDPEPFASGIEQIRGDVPLRDEVELAPFLMAVDSYVERDFERLQGGLPELREPTDSEWEWAVRAGGRTVFWWGDRPPERADAPWFLPDDHPLGLRSIGWREERCVGETDPSQDTVTYRGGVEDSMPWQNTGEFLALLSAYRMRCRFGTAVCRPVIPL